MARALSKAAMKARERCGSRTHEACIQPRCVAHPGGRLSESCHLNDHAAAPAGVDRDYTADTLRMRVQIDL
ncbi:MAG: hypothetical protein ABW203_01950 [Novosphingobium sp.]